MSDVLRLEKVTRTYPQGNGVLEVFRGIDMALAPGELVALVGPSGAGKSSLLHIAGLLETPSGGEVFIEGAPVSMLPDRERTLIRRDTIGFVYQAHHLLPEFSALENVVMPQRIAGKPRTQSERDATHILSHLGLGQRLDHRPAQLSGGEQQRVAIARALANRPRILLADEPTGNLDERTAAGVFAALIDLVRSEGLAALVATHNLVLHEGRLLDGGKLGAKATAERA
jgi:lipoprotein-releasing system ATP-binding protein